MRNFIIYLFFLSGLLPLGVRAETLQLRNDAPARYVVVPGDTLWGISARFLKDPWKWPQIWGMNRSQIENPDRIYPGDAIVVENVGGKPRLKLEKQGGEAEQAASAEEKPQERETVRLSPGIQIRDLGRAIANIPLSAIGPFLTKTRIVDSKAWENAPKLIAGQDKSEILGTGEYGYVSSLEGSVSWDIFGKPTEIEDPDTGKPLGLEVHYLGEAKLVNPGKPARIVILRAYGEVEIGARLVPSLEQTVTHYVPHAPDAVVRGRILSSDGGLTEIGQNDIVLINLGSRDGLELGHVLAVYRAGLKVGGETLPDERIGLAMIFRIYDGLAYALVVQSLHTIHPGDTVRTP